MSWSWLFDDFNRTASSTAVGTAPTGQAWVNDYGTLGIDGSGRLYCPAAAGGGRDYIETGVSDFTLTISLPHRDATSEAWVHFRVSSPGNQLWRFGASGGGSYVLQKYNNPTLTSFTTSVTPASGDVIEIACSGTSITVKVNGSTAVSQTDSFNQTATQVGIELFSSGTNGNTFDSLDVPAAMSAAADFGLYLPNNTEVDAYYNGVLKDRFSAPDAHASGSDLAVAAFYDQTTLGGDPSVLVSIDGVEVYDRPGGTLLLSDDFTTFTGWSLANNGSQWRNWPAGHLTAQVPAAGGPDHSAMIYQAMPVGAAYIVLKGVSFSTAGGDDSWAMALLNTAGGSTDTPFHGSGGVLPYYYRLLMRRPGSADPAPTKTARGTSAQPVTEPDTSVHLGRGWVVGAVTMN